MSARRITKNMPSTDRAATPARRAARTLVLVVCGLIALRSTARGADVRITKIDGTTATGSWIGSPDGRTLTLRLTDGPVTLRLDDLATVEFSVAGAHRPRAQREPDHPAQDALPAVFYLADGGRLFGQLIEPTQDDKAGLPVRDSVMGSTALGRPTRLPFDRLAGVEFADRKAFPLAHEAFTIALASRRPGKDILITRERPAFAGSDDDPQTKPPRPAEPAKSVAGRLVSLGPRVGSFVFSDRQRSFQTPRIYGVVLATGVWDASSPAARREFPVTIKLIDGSTFSGRIEQADRETIHVATSLNANVTLDLSDIATLTITSERVVYVSDLKPTTQTTAGILHRPWPPRFDQNVAGGPLSLGGREYHRGLGVHSKAELGFDVDGAYETFVATIGIDDSVRPRGSVVFRVDGDGRMLYESGAVTGKDDPIDIRVDVTNVQRVRLIVDFGDGLDLADHADWASARFLKPSPPVDAKAQ